MTITTQISDDGSTISYDDFGNVVGVTDNQGNPVQSAGAAGSPIVQQFANLFTYGIRSIINAKYPAGPGTPAPAAATAAQASQNTVQLALLAGAVFLAYRLLAK